MEQNSSPDSIVGTSHAGFPAVPDGAVDPQRFEQARLRIVWFLKQVNDPAHTWTGLLEMLKQFGEAGTIDRGGQATARPVAKVSYGLLHPDHDPKIWLESPATYAPALLEIAIVNACEHGGEPAIGEEWREIQACFLSREALIKQKIRALKPNLVILGGTTWLVQNWFPNWEVMNGKFDSIKDSEGTRWVHAYHPANRRGDRAYLEAIRSVIPLEELAV